MEYLFDKVSFLFQFKNMFAFATWQPKLGKVWRRLCNRSMVGLRFSRQKQKIPKGTLAYKSPPRFQSETATTLAEYVTIVTTFEVNVYHENKSRNFLCNVFLYSNNKLNSLTLYSNNKPNVSLYKTYCRKFDSRVIWSSFKRLRTHANFCQKPRNKMHIRLFISSEYWKSVAQEPTIFILVSGAWSSNFLCFSPPDRMQKWFSFINQAGERTRSKASWLRKERTDRASNND